MLPSARSRRGGHNADCSQRSRSRDSDHRESFAKAVAGGEPPNCLFESPSSTSPDLDHRHPTETEAARGGASDGSLELPSLHPDPLTTLLKGSPAEEGLSPRLDAEHRQRELSPGSAAHSRRALPRSAARLPQHLPTTGMPTAVPRAWELRWNGINHYDSNAGPAQSAPPAGAAKHRGDRERREERICGGGDGARSPTPQQTNRCRLSYRDPPPVRHTSRA